MPARPLVPELNRKVTPVGEYLDRQVELLRDAHRHDDRLAARLIRATGRGETTEGEVRASELTLEQARFAIARDHGYPDWGAVRARAADPIDAEFEAACDAIQWGDLETLRALLDARPELVRARSPFPHRSALLHHVAANGIEVERQIQSPANAVEIMRLLLERGAEADALCDTYGGGRDQTTMCLLVSSCVPAQAGVQAALVDELCRGGAQVNGLDDNGAPLWTATTFGYTKAAEALARSGARVDSIVFAAALGDLEAVQSCFDAGGTLDLDRARGVPRAAGVPELEPDRLLDYALTQAALHGRRDVVAFLLEKQPDLGFEEPFFHSTARGAARYRGYDEIVALLDAAKS
jgi:hypothetical protein